MKINGFEVIEVHSRPKIQLSERVTVSGKFRQEFDSWLAESFGYESPLGPHETLISESEKKIFVTQRVYHALMREEAGRRVIFG